MYGEDDYALGMEVGFPAQHTVGVDGKFISGTHDSLDGRYVKDCDSDIINLLEQNQNKINWWCLSSNPNAIPLLEKNPDKIEWRELNNYLSIWF